MVPTEALKLALGNEKAAVKLYNKLYNQYPQLQDIFEFLINEEEKHTALIEKRIAQLVNA